MHLQLERLLVVPFQTPVTRCCFPSYSRDRSLTSQLARQGERERERTALNRAIQCGSACVFVRVLQVCSIVPMSYLIVPSWSYRPHACLCGCPQVPHHPSCSEFSCFYLCVCARNFSFRSTWPIVRYGHKNPFLPARRTRQKLLGLCSCDFLPPFRMSFRSFFFVCIVGLSF